MFDTVLVPVPPGGRDGVAAQTAAVIAAAFGCPTTTLTIEAGDPTDSLTRLLEGRPSSLLCMSTAARTGVSELVLGSTASAVVRATTHSVVLVGPRAEAPASIAVLVAAVDGSRASERAAHAAGVWARMLDARLHLVRVAPPSEPGDAHDSVVDLQRLAADIHRGIGLHPDWEVLHDEDVAHALAQYAKDVGASLVAVTPHGRGASDRVLGSDAMRIVHESPVPVLAVPGGHHAT